MGQFQMRSRGRGSKKSENFAYIISGGSLGYLANSDVKKYKDLHHIVEAIFQNIALQNQEGDLH